MGLKSKIISLCNRYAVQMAEMNAKNISTAILHQKTFPQFQNICRGKSVVVCGAGPTLQQYQPIAGAVHIAINRAFLYDKVKFDYIFAQDYEGINMVQEELVAYERGHCVKLLGMQNGQRKKEIPHELAARADALRFNTDVYIYQDGFKSRFVHDIDSRALGNMPNVGLSVMQFALYMNPDRIYIVGCDMSGGHFINPNMSKEEIDKRETETKNGWADSYLERTIDKWKEFKRFAQLYYPHTQIISVNPIGLKGIFEDLYQCE